MRTRRPGRGQLSMARRITRTVPPQDVFNADRATTDDEVHRVREFASVEWATYCHAHIEGWPDRATDSPKP